MNQTVRLGNPGERFAAAMLWQSMLGELHPATSADEGHKIDLRLNYDCPFSENRRELRCQVKSGDSYGMWTPTKNRFRINLKPEFRDKLSKNDNPTLLVWIPTSDEIPRYALIPRRRDRGSIYILNDSFLNPAMTFDVARRQILLGEKSQVRETNFSRSASLQEALRKLKDFRKTTAKLESPIFRNLRIPNAAIRHVTRNSRPTNRRCLSCDVAKFLPQVVKWNPKRAQCLNRIDTIGSRRTRVKRLYLVEYPKVFKTSDQSNRTPEPL